MSTVVGSVHNVDIHTVLSDAKLRKLSGKPIPKLIEMPDSGGLSIRVTPLGLVVFQYRYRFGSKPRRMTLGSYDDLSLKGAREMVQEAKRILLSGRDPITVKEMELESKAASVTVSLCINHWLESAQAKRLVRLKKPSLITCRREVDEILDASLWMLYQPMQHAFIGRKRVGKIKKVA